MKVKDLMTASVSCVTPDTSLIQAARQMKQENVGSIPVCSDKGEVLGIVTDRDLVVRSLANGDEAAADVPVKAVMSTELVCATPDMDTHDAALLLSKYQIRRLPVISSGRLAGILSLGDIARKTLFIDEAGDVLSAVSKPGGLS